jgi:prepilin-type N-terminal cleavage/methylation domain-containing protein/prepilin-type processing-associated H-X9-DG protein
MTPADRHHRFAFTLIELLVTVAIIAILASLLLSGLTQARIKARALMCLGNCRQLQIAWHLYATESDDRLPPNSGQDPRIWINMNYGLANRVRGCTNLATVRLGLLFRYAGGDRIYVCPEQKAVFSGTISGDPFFGHGTFTGDLLNAAPARSFSISQQMDGVTLDRSERFNKTLSGIRNPPPSSALVFVDENLYTIDDGIFAPPQANRADSPLWVNIPAARHGNSGILSFADGHCESHKWVEPSTARFKTPRGFVLAPGTVSPLTNKDINWVLARMLPPQ